MKVWFCLGTRLVISTCEPWATADTLYNLNVTPSLVGPIYSVCTFLSVYSTDCARNTSYVQIIRSRDMKLDGQEPRIDIVMLLHLCMVLACPQCRRVPPIAQGGGRGCVQAGEKRLL